jgi:hypothetical protein
MLEQSPAILDTLLRSATASPNPDQVSFIPSPFHQQVNFPKSYALCMLLLTDPLPEKVPLPASAQHFFIQAVKDAIRAPSATSLWRVYNLLTGACSGLPRVLPSEDWLSLEEELTKIVRSARTIQDHSMSLICFGIMYALAVPNATEASSAIDITTDHNGIQFKSDAALDFFSGAKAYKSLNLAALQVTWASKPNVGVPRKEALRLLDIALDIFRVVDQSLLKQWSESSDGQTNIRRITGKLLETDVDPEIQLQVCTVYFSELESCSNGKVKQEY